MESTSLLTMMCSLVVCDAEYSRCKRRHEENHAAERSSALEADKKINHDKRFRPTYSYL